MEKKESKVRVYAILQDSVNGRVEMVGCWTNYEDCLNVCEKLNKIYTQEYYISDCLLNFDYQKELGK